jgi:hypothetical protein
MVPLFFQGYSSLRLLRNLLHTIIEYRSSSDSEAEISVLDELCLSTCFSRAADRLRDTRVF